MWRRYRHFGADDEASLHWRYNLPSPNPSNSGARLVSCLSEKFLVSTFEIFHFNLPPTGQGFPIRAPGSHPQFARTRIDSTVLGSRSKFTMETAGSNRNSVFVSGLPDVKLTGLGIKQEVQFAAERFCTNDHLKLGS